MSNQTQETTHQTLKRIEEELQQLKKRIANLEDHLNQPQRETLLAMNRVLEAFEYKGGKDKVPLTPQQILEIDLMNLPDSLRKTMMAISQLRQADAEEVAERTNRTRGLERMNCIEKIKDGKRTHFQTLRTI